MAPEGKEGTTTAPAADDFGEDRAPFLPSWDFETDPVLVATILSKEVVEGVRSNLSDDTRDLDLFTVVTDDGERFTVWGGGMIGRVFNGHMGHRVRAENKGLKQQEDKTQLRVFDIRCATCTAEGR